MKSCQPSWMKQEILECVWPFCIRIFCLRKKKNCIYDETREEHNINMTDCVSKTMDNDVEQALE